MGAGLRKTLRLLYYMGEIMKAYIDPKECVGCGACIAECPERAIIMLPGWISRVQREKCVGCGKCVDICHKKAPSLQEEGITVNP